MIVVGPNGEEIEFPDGTPREVMASAMQARFGAPRRSVRGGSNLGAPTRGKGQKTDTVALDALQGQAERTADNRRRMQMASLPHGLGGVPGIGALLDPDRRMQLGADATGLIGFLSRSAQSPTDLGEIASQTGERISEGVANLPQLPEQIAQNLPQIAREITYGPFVDEEAAQVDLERARLSGDQGGVMSAAREANERGAASAVNVAAPVAASGIRTARGAAQLGAGLTAPPAMARAEGDTLQERLPSTIADTLAGASTAGALQSVANAVPRLMNLPSRSVQRAQQFEQAGVRPNLAAIQGGASAGMSKLVGENFIAGGRVRRALQNSLDDTRDAAARISADFGQHGPREQVGESIQRGVNRFARDRSVSPPPGPAASTPTRDWSFAAKANALYDRVFSTIARDESALLNGGVGSQVTTQSTEAALNAIRSRVAAPNVADLVNDPLLGKIAGALEADRGAMRFNDLRALRTWVREAQRNPQLRQTIDDASLQRLEAALTDDIFASASAIGGDVAAQQLRRVDQYYRAGQQRIKNALQPFAQGGGAQAYRRIVALAQEGGRENARALQSLRRSLKPDEWREVAATVIDDLGKPNPGNPAVLEPGAFSVDNFVSNYARLSKEGRRILFSQGDGELAAALDNLAQVAGYQKGVERMANASRSGINVQNVGIGAGLLNPATAGPTLGLLATMAISGEALTNPAFVRWLTSASRSGNVAGLRRATQELAQLAARDPALIPAYQSLVQALQSERPDGGSSRPGYTQQSDTGRLQ